MLPTSKRTHAEDNQHNYIKPVEWHKKADKPRLIQEPTMADRSRRVINLSREYARSLPGDVGHQPLTDRRSLWVLRLEIEELAEVGRCRFWLLQLFRIELAESKPGVGIFRVIREQPFKFGR